MPTLLILALLLAVLGGAVALFLYGRWGTGLVWEDAPGGPLHYRLARSSQAALTLRWLRRVAKGVNSAFSLWGCIRVAASYINPEHLAHELGHLVKEREQGRVPHLLGYFTGKAKAEEAWCANFGAVHRTDKHIEAVSRTLRS